MELSVEPEQLAVNEATTPQTGLDEATAMNNIFMRESGNNPSAINPTSGACGLPQSLPCSKMNCELSEAGRACQTEWARQYAVSRYGSFVQAWEFWLANNWW